MKKIPIITGFIMVLFSVPALAASIDLGFNAGVMNPDNDTTVKETFSKDFYWQAHLGLKGDNQWEGRANLGRYADTSHNPDDLGTNLRLGVTTLTGSLIYHFTDDTDVVQPYLGGGVGGYFYDVRDDIYGELETGTEFGTHLLGGLKVNITEGLHVSGEYTRHFIPSIFFNNANNFDTSALTIGVGFDIPLRKKSVTRAQTQTQYPYSEAEEKLLIQIQQVRTEIKEIETQLKTNQNTIDQFYATTTYDKYNPEFNDNYDRIKFLEKKQERLKDQLSAAQQELLKLQQSWTSYRPEPVSQVEEHVVYVEKHYHHSPHPIYYHNGFLTRTHQPYKRRYYRSVPVVKRKVKKNKVVKTKTERVEDRKEFAEKKKQRLLELKNR